MFTRRFAAGLTGLVLATTALAGCAESSSPQADSSSSDHPAAQQRYQARALGGTDDGTPVSGGVLRVADYYEAPSLDPLRLVATGSSGGNPAMALYGTLVRYDHAAEEFVPYMAKALTPNDDATEWTLDLRQDVTFSDGTPFDAAAVRAAVNRFTALPSFMGSMLKNSIAGIAMPNDRQLVFTLASAWSTFDSVLASEVGMIPAPAAYEKAQFTPIGAGPFTFGSHAPTEHLTLNANPTYWEGAPHLDGVKFVWQAEDRAKAEALDAGDVDLAFMRDIKTVDQRLDRARGYVSVLNVGNALQINQAAGRPGSDPRVLQAIGHALDREKLYERVFGSDELAGGGLFAESSRWYSGSDDPQYDPEAARKLLAEAVAEGYDATITYLGGTGSLGESQYVTIKGMLEAVGFTVSSDLVASASARYEKMHVQRDFDLAWGSMGMPDEMVYLRLRSNVVNNAGSYANAEMDSLLDSLQAATEDETQKQAVADVQSLWSRTLPMLRLGAVPVLTEWSDKVHGIDVTTEHTLLLGKAWLS